MKPTQDYLTGSSKNYKLEFTDEEFKHLFRGELTREEVVVEMNRWEKENKKSKAFTWSMQDRILKLWRTKIPDGFIIIPNTNYHINKEGVVIHASTRKKINTLKQNRLNLQRAIPLNPEINVARAVWTLFKRELVSKEDSIIFKDGNKHNCHIDNLFIRKKYDTIKKMEELEKAFANNTNHVELMEEFTIKDNFAIQIPKVFKDIIRPDEFTEKEFDELLIEMYSYTNQELMDRVDDFTKYSTKQHLREMFRVHKKYTEGMGDELMPKGFKYAYDTDRYIINREGVIVSLIQRRFISSYVTGNGYASVGLVLKSTDERNTSFLLHRLLKYTFDKYDERPIDHIDCNKLNNSLDNLEYVTPAENNRRAQANGLIDYDKVRGENNIHAKLKNKDVEEIRSGLLDTYSNVILGKIYGVDSRTMSRVRNGYQYKSVERGIRSDELLDRLEKKFEPIEDKFYAVPENIRFAIRYNLKDNLNEKDTKILNSLDDITLHMIRKGLPYN